MHYEIEFQLDLEKLIGTMPAEWEDSETTQFTLDAGNSLSKAYEMFNTLKAANRFRPQIKYIRLVFHTPGIANSKPMEYVLAYASKDTEW